MKCTIDELTPEGFKAVAEGVFQKTIDDTFAGVDVRELEIPLAVHLWIIDGQKAIFAIPTHLDIDIEHGFQTLDAKLIAGLKAIFNRYLEKASPAQRQS